MRNDCAKNCFINGFTNPNENLTSLESFLMDNNQGAKRTEAYGDAVLRFDALYCIECGDAIELEDTITPLATSAKFKPRCPRV